MGERNKVKQNTSIVAGKTFIGPSYAYAISLRSSRIVFALGDTLINTITYAQMWSISVYSITQCSDDLMWTTMNSHIRMHTVCARYIQQAICSVDLQYGFISFQAKECQVMTIVRNSNTLIGLLEIQFRFGSWAVTSVKTGGKLPQIIHITTVYSFDGEMFKVLSSFLCPLS